MKKLYIEIYYDGKWHRAARFQIMGDEQIQKGYRGASTLVYEEEYVASHLAFQANQALSVNYPISFNYYENNHWPPFLLDIMPAGAGRRALLNLHNMPDEQARSDWFLLNFGATNPPGNIRIAPTNPVEQPLSHPGFDKTEIIARKDQFLEYARANGAPVSGSTGAQGDAPKFLLTTDKQGKWHADGALDDALACEHYLVKFPRGNTLKDKQVLAYEAIYHKIATELGLHTYKTLELIDNTLFIPRFDRVTHQKKLLRHGLESLCSAAGVADFGQAFDQFKLVAAFLPHMSKPTESLSEFLKRDILNIAMGNTDNHARNTAIIKYENGETDLAPLYDFAPMILDPEGIVRTCKWKEAETIQGIDYNLILKKLENTHANSADFQKVRSNLIAFKAQLQKLPSLLQQHEIEPDFINFLAPKIQSQMDALGAITNG